MTSCLLQESSLWVQSSLRTCPLVALGASSLSSAETLVQRAWPLAAFELFCLLETEVGLEEEVMPTVWGRIPIRKGGIFFLRCGAHGELGMRTVLWAHELGMRTDNAQDCLTPFPQPNSGPALSLHLLIFLKRTGGWEPCLSDLSCPKESSCSLIPGACFPKSCLGHLGETPPLCFPLCKCFGV